MELSLIVAIGKDGAIGRKGELIWKIPADLKRFKSITDGHTIIMGRKTWDSLPKKPLPGRKNIVVTRNPDFEAEGAIVVDSIEKALSLKETGEVFVIGGAEIYNSMLPYVSKLYLTEVDALCENADTFLNLDLEKDWDLIEDSDLESTKDGVNYRYRNYLRKKA